MGGVAPHKHCHAWLLRDQGGHGVQAQLGHCWLRGYHHDPAPGKGPQGTRVVKSHNSTMSFLISFLDHPQSHHQPSFRSFASSPTELTPELPLVGEECCLLPPPPSSPHFPLPTFPWILVLIIPIIILRAFPCISLSPRAASQHWSCPLPLHHDPWHYLLPNHLALSPASGPTF